MLSILQSRSGFYPIAVWLIRQGRGKSVIRIFRQLSYSVSRATGELLVDQTTILRQLDIALNSNELAAVEYEKQSAGILLDQELFRQLIFQLSFIQI